MRSGGEDLYPNLYLFFVGAAGIGKSRPIRKARQYYKTIPGHNHAPDSMSATSLLEALQSHKVGGKAKGENDLIDNLDERNSMYITADELNAFLHSYDQEAIAYMCKFYDVDSFHQTRSTNKINRVIHSGQLNITAGTTPPNLMSYMPPGAWEQGFASRIIMIFSDLRYITDDFAEVEYGLNEDLVHDLLSIATTKGQFSATKEFQALVTEWKEAGEEPRPTHPKLLHYATRRTVHLYKLSMVASMDRSESLILTAEDWHRARGWLEDAESVMTDVFKAGAGNTDAKAMDEIYYYMLAQSKNGRTVPEYRLWKFAKEHVPAMSVQRLVENMVRAGQLEKVSYDKARRTWMWKATVPESLDGEE